MFGVGAYIREHNTRAQDRIFARDRWFAAMDRRGCRLVPSYRITHPEDTFVSFADYLKRREERTPSDWKYEVVLEDLVAAECLGKTMPAELADIPRLRVLFVPVATLPDVEPLCAMKHLEVVVLGRATAADLRTLDCLPTLREVYLGELEGDLPEPSQHRFRVVVSNELPH
jgi:hypothetical protein